MATTVIPQFRSRYLQERFEEGLDDWSDTMQTSLLYILSEIERCRRARHPFKTRAERAARIARDVRVAESRVRQNLREASTGPSFHATLAACRADNFPGRRAPRSWRGRRTMAATFFAADSCLDRWPMFCRLRAYESSGRLVSVCVIPAGEVELIEQTLAGLRKWCWPRGEEAAARALARAKNTRH
jgi:hypothetical protein